VIGTSSPSIEAHPDETRQRDALPLLSRRLLDPPVGHANRTRAGDGRDQPISGVSVPRHEGVSRRIPLRPGPRQGRPLVGPEGGAPHLPGSVGRSRLRSTVRLPGWSRRRGRSDRRSLLAGHHGRLFCSSTGRVRRAHGWWRVDKFRELMLSPEQGARTDASHFAAVTMTWVTWQWRPGSSALSETEARDFERAGAPTSEGGIQGPESSGTRW